MEVPYSCSIGHCCVQVKMKSQGWLCCTFQTQDSELFGNANHMPLESLSRAMRVIHAFHSDPLILKKTTNSSWLYSWYPSLSWPPYIKWKPCILKKMTLNMHSWLTCFLISLFIYTYPRTSYSKFSSPATYKSKEFLMHQEWMKRASIVVFFIICYGYPGILFSQLN